MAIVKNGYHQLKVDMKHIHILYLAFLLLPYLGHTQNFNDYFQSLRAEESPSFPYELIRGDFDAQGLLDELQAYASDTSAQVLKGLYFGYYQVGKRTQSEGTRRQVVDRLTAGLLFQQKGLSGLLTNYLDEFSVTDFSPSARQSLLQALDAGQGDLEMLPGLCARLSLEGAIASIRRVMRQTSRPRVRWACYIALSRLGDAEAIRYVVRRSRAMPVGDDLVYEVVPDLIFTRQKEIIDYLVELVSSDDRLCLPADPDQTRQVNCAYRLLEALAPVITNFPLSVSDSGDLSVTNYREALSSSRQWFEEHPNYQLNP